MIYVIETTVVDPAKREIVRDGDRVDVEPRVFDLIVYLASQAERVISKDELIAQIWDGRAIADTTLSSCVKAARRALRDDGRTQRLIRTFHRRGFRFVGPLQVVDSIGFNREAGAGDIDSQPPEDIDLDLPAKPSIAALPFAAASEDPDQRLLVQGLLSDITSGLARTRWLFVTARASAARFRSLTPDPVEIGRLLGVRYLLHGSIIRASDSIRLTVVLSETAQGGEIWTERLEHKIDDLFAAQDEICELVVASVEAEIELKERQRARLRPLASLDAWSAYHRGIDLLQRYQAAHHHEAQQCLKKASALDPGSARAFAGLSFLHWQRAFLKDTQNRDNELQHALELSQQSISLDPRDPLGHWAHGRTSLLTGDLGDAIESLTTATKLNPSFAHAEYSRGYGLVLNGDFDGAIACSLKARRPSPYDPLSVHFMLLHAETYALMGDAENARKWARRATVQRQSFDHLYAIVAWCCELAGDRESAADYCAELVKRRPDYSRAIYFRTFPFQEPGRSAIDAALHRLGIP